MLECFLNQPIIIETPAGQIVGVLLRADTSEHGGIGFPVNLRLHWSVVSGQNLDRNQDRTFIYLR
jgi:hypothetical protein